MDTDISNGYFSRRIHRRESDFWMLQNSVSIFDCEREESVEENPSMLKLFDSIVQRELSPDENEDSDEDTIR